MKPSAMPKGTEIIIGEFFPQPATGSRVITSVYATQGVQGEMVVTDGHGQVRLTAPFDLVMEGDALELDIGGLPAGEYQVHINMLGEQWERRLWVQR